MGVCNCSMFCCTLLYVHSSIAFILMEKRELDALLNLSFWCLVMVEWLFSDQTHLLFLICESWCYVYSVCYNSSYLSAEKGVDPKHCIYQSPLILTELFQHNLINVSYLTACYLYQVMMTLHFLNGANDAESAQKSKITS